MPTDRDRHRRQLWRRVFDLALAAALLSSAVGLILELRPVLAARTSVPLLLALAVVHVAPILLRRSRPSLALSISLGAALIAITLGLPFVRLGPVALVLVYTHAALRPRSVSAIGVAATLLLVGVAAPLEGYGYDLATIATYSALVVGAWLLGDTVRQRQEALEAHAERAVQLEAAREELARAAVSAERLRIARELHDIVAHGLSVIAVHAGSGRLAASRDPQVGVDALTTIERTSRATLDEMRRLLGVLREDGEDAATAPLPDLHRLPDLVASFADAGLPVDMDVEGDLEALPIGIHLTAYRLVQEALTNVLKHAGPVPTTVTVRAGADALDIDVTDQGALSAVASETGHGTIGMRERVAVYGGDLRIGPAPGGGWHVRARLPLTGVGT